MTIVLHRFPLSHFSEKGRALLRFKKLPYRIEEHRLGLPQIKIFRLSGQRRVPVIEDDGKVVSDSTKIALYLEERYPEPHLLPNDPKLELEVMNLEDRIDRVFGFRAPVIWFDRVVRHEPEELAHLIAIEMYPAGRGKLLAGAFRTLWRAPRVESIVKKAEHKTRELLDDLCKRLEASDFLVGDRPTLADVAAASLAFHLEFPEATELAVPELAGVGVPGWADASEYQRFFEWRREFYDRHLS